MRHLALSLIAVSFLAACAPQSPETTDIYGRRELPQPEKPVIPQYDPIAPDEIKWINVDGGPGELEFNPRVDILFVIDNSDSMKSAQANLVRNINSFAAGLQKNKMIDYHIGVTSVWDSSERYTKNPNNVYKLGELRNVKNSAGQSLAERFVSKANAGSLLASTLNIGIAPYTQGGPETEEIFTPIQAAIQSANTGRGGPNEGFFRDDAQLVIVILTDADDGAKDVTAEQLAQELFDFKNGNRSKVSVYAALVKASDDDQYKDWGLKIHPTYHPECFNGSKPKGTCKGFGPDKIVEFVVKANAEHGSPAEVRANNIMSLVQKDFGKDLAKIGNDIVVKTLAKTIRLPQVPRRDANNQLMIRVKYGNQVIPASKGGWVYNARDKSITISGEVNYQYQDGARFVVEMVPVTVRKME